ncbi:MAG: hypothetical protein ABIJ16_00200 [Bacteroidota bacterium]
MGIFDKIFGNKPKESERELLHHNIYTIVPPAIQSGEVYHFTTDSGVQYEVRLGKIKDSLARVINFNVLNDEYADNEYAATNKGEIFRVVATVIRIMEMYIEQHPYIRSYEFTGEHKEGQENRETSVRTLFFCRALRRAFAGSPVDITGNRGKLILK